MKNKSKLSYIKLIEALQSIHEKYNRGPWAPLRPSKISCDAEKAFINGMREAFDETLPVRICSFHQKQAWRRRLVAEFKKCEKTDIKYREKVFSVLRACVFSPFCENLALRDDLYDILREKVSKAPQPVRQAVENFILYLKFTWLNSDGHLSFTNWDHFNDTLAGDSDSTNNVSESINSGFNRTINVGYKSYKRVCRSIKKHKCRSIDHVWDTVGAGRQDLRKKCHRERIANRKFYVTEFDKLSVTEQRKQYKTFLNQILTTLKISKKKK